MREKVTAVCDLDLDIGRHEVFGLLGPLFNFFVARALDGVERLRSPYLPALVVGGAIGWLAWVDPVFIGGGYRLIADALAGKIAVGLLLIVFVARYAGTVLCYAAGAPGGIFAPMLALGTVLGLWFGDVDDLTVHLSSGDDTLDIGNTHSGSVTVLALGGDDVVTAQAVSGPTIIDLGPKGGDEGGRVIVAGTPEEVAAKSGSYTGEVLARVLKS